MERLSAEMRELTSQFRNPLELFKRTGILLPIAGGAKGYNETANLLTRTVDGVPLDELWTEFVQTLAILNEQRTPLVERLTFQVERPFEQVMPILTEEFEEADEFAQPVGIRLGQPWNMGYPLKYYDLGVRFTFRWLGRATSGEVRALNNTALEADYRLIYRTLFNRIFNNRTVVATLEDTGTVVNTYPFYNGAVDTLPVAPPSWKSYDFATSHNHYLASGGATVDSADLDEMYDHVYHHGYVAGGATCILLVNREQANTIRTFRIANGARNDFFPKPGTAFYGTMTGTLPAQDTGVGLAATFPGFIGTYGELNIVEEDMIPAKYMILFASGGRYAERNPVGMREHENAPLRGLKLIPQFERYPLRESFYHHAIGAGVRHMGAGVVMQVTTNGSYAAPASFTLGGPGGR